MFEKIVKTINSTGKAVGEKTKQGTDLVKMNMKIAAEEKELNDLYCEIGKLYYENNIENPCCDDMKALFDKVTAKTDDINTHKSQARMLKGVVSCVNCGADMPLNNDFCGKCGAKLEKPEPIVNEIDEKEEIDFEECADHESTVEVTDADGDETMVVEEAENETAETETEE